MKTNRTGLSLIKKYEDLRLTSYLCSGGRWTIGYGTTTIEGKAVTDGMKITKEQALQYFKNDITLFETSVSKSLNIETLNKNQFSALVSFAYNVGITAFRTSTLLRLVKENPNHIDIPEQFKRWNKAGGVVQNGLIKRREAEIALYLKPIKK
jgi:lysozyme